MTDTANTNNYSEEINVEILDEVTGGLIQDPDKSKKFYMSRMKECMKMILSRNNNNKDDPLYKLFAEIYSREGIILPTDRVDMILWAHHADYLTYDIINMYERTIDTISIGVVGPV